MSDEDRKQRLAQLEVKIAAAKGEPVEKPHIADHYSQAHLAWRMVIELVTGLGIGFGIGYGLDSLFGTLPIFLVLFILLGLAAGIRTMLRSAREIQQTQLAQAAANDDENKDEGT